VLWRSGALNEGHYVLSVEAKDSNGVQSKALRLAFTIEPPWYRTLWMEIVWGIFQNCPRIDLVMGNRMGFYPPHVKTFCRLNLAARLAEKVAAEAFISAFHERTFDYLRLTRS
jgi:hypothetical protein